MSLTISFNNKESFTAYEKMSIRHLLHNNYSYAPFYAMVVQNTCINVIKSFHQDDGDTYPHFNIAFYNARTNYVSVSYHVYVDLEAEKIKKITYISVL